MPRLFSLPIKDEMRFARLAGGGDFDQSIAILADGLAAATDDVSRLDLIERIGLCHWGARRPGDAIETLNKALAISPNSFFSLKLLSECHAMKDEHDTAAAFARRALEAYPEPLPKVPRFLSPRLPRNRAPISEVQGDFEGRGSERLGSGARYARMVLVGQGLLEMIR